MTSFFERVSDDIFQRLANYSEGGAELSVSFVEIAGDYCFDLFNQFAPVGLVQVRDGGFQPWPVAEPRVHSPKELLDLIRYGCGVRTTAATGVHDASSRSHAVLRIYVRTFSGKAVREGVLSLIDLAGKLPGLIYQSQLSAHPPQGRSTASTPCTTPQNGARRVLRSILPWQH